MNILVQICEYRKWRRIILKEFEKGVTKLIVELKKNQSTAVDSRDIWSDKKEFARWYVIITIEKKNIRNYAKVYDDDDDADDNDDDISAWT